jgi:dipeptidyl aminopeptidase/acylaminoacyl peptidase
MCFLGVPENRSVGPPHTSSSVEGRMSHFRAVFQISVVFVAAVSFSQTGGKPSEKIVFVRPDPIITTSSSRAMLSADYVGGKINRVDSPEMKFNSVADAKMNLLAFMNPDGSGITDLHVNGFDPSVSPDGTKIAFCSLRDDQYSQIYVMNSDGSEQKRLTKVTTGDACGPVWSHDGKKIAFYAFSLPHPSRNPAIWVMDPDGTNLTKLTEHAVSPTWSPDDRQIAFASDRIGKFQIFAMNSDGSNVRRLTNDKGEDSSPAWAPDGAAIVFVSDRESEHPALFLMGADGSEQHRLVFSKRQDFCFPAWSLDGRTIVFSSLNRVATQFITVGEERPRCEMWTGEYQLFSFDSEGKLHQLTNTKYMAMKPTFGRLAAAH